MATGIPITGSSSGVHTGVWDVASNSGQGFQYFRDSLVTYACYGRDDHELILFVPTNPSATPFDPILAHRVYAVEIDGNGAINSQRLLLSDAAYPKSPWGGIVSPISTSGQSLTVLRTNFYLYQVNLTSGYATKLMAGNNPNLRE